MSNYEYEIDVKSDNSNSTNLKLRNNLNKSDNNESLFCKDHGFCLIHMYCTNCSKLICDKCLKLYHSNHNIREYGPLNENTAKEWLENITKSIDEELNFNLPQFKEKVNKRIYNTDIYETEMLEYVDKIFNNIVCLLENFKKKTKNTINLKISSLREQMESDIYMFDSIKRKLEDCKLYYIINLA